MDAYKAKELALELMDKHGLFDEGYHFDFHNKRTAAGTCSYKRKTIFLSLPLTILSDEVEVIDTILHEIAHALAGFIGEYGHGHGWVRIAKSIGCDGKRCFSSKTKPSMIEAYKKIAKYKAVCKNGHEHFMNRLPKYQYSCGKCSKKHDINHLLKYQRVN